MGEAYLASRLDLLRRTQNADGGWGYFAGKASWLEPTAYAALALLGEAASDRAWSLVSCWQTPHGSWRPSGDVNLESSGTSLGTILALARNQQTAAQQGVRWLLGTSGVETNLQNRVLVGLGLVKPDRDVNLKGWPWKPNTSSWVEPTSLALIALKLAAPKSNDSQLKERVRLGEAQLLDVRCSDGGWNYGSRAALGVDLTSYPETTAVALAGLQGRQDLGGAFDLARRLLQTTPSPLARAWLTLALRLNGLAAEVPATPASNDIMIAALEALAAPDGNHRLLKTGVAA